MRIKSTNKPTKTQERSLIDILLPPTFDYKNSTLKVNRNSITSTKDYSSLPLCAILYNRVE
jgi:hypothetical protein